MCITFGKSNFKERQWQLGGSILQEANTIKYLGVHLSGNNKEHMDARVKATRAAFFALKSAGVFSKDTSSNVITYIFNTALRPVLLYGHESIFQHKNALDKAEKLQSKLIKAATCLKPSCRNTPLLRAMKVTRIGVSIEQQEIKLLKSMLTSNSRSHNLYNYLLADQLAGNTSSKRNLVRRVLNTCNKYNLSLVKCLCEHNYIYHSFRKITGDNDGISDTVEYLLSNLTDESREQINMLLSPFQNPN